MWPLLIPATEERQSNETLSLLPCREKELFWPDYAGIGNNVTGVSPRGAFLRLDSPDQGGGGVPGPAIPPPVARYHSHGLEDARDERL